MKDYITQQIELLIRYNKVNFYKLKKNLKEKSLDLDKITLIKRIKQL
jgi:hypothetical protein